jgi:hypothetical protein
MQAGPEAGRVASVDQRVDQPAEPGPVFARGQQQCRRWLAKQLRRLPQLCLSSDEVQPGDEDCDFIGRGVALCSLCSVVWPCAACW